MKITTVVPFPANPAAVDEGLKINDRTAAPATGEDLAVGLELERRRMQEDAEALQLREENLREYEARLRALQSEMDAARATATRSTPPFAARSTAPFAPDDSSLDAAWQKLHRTREIFEAEQAHLRDDRLAMRALEAAMKEREAALAVREARVQAQEELLAAAMPRPKPRKEKRETLGGEENVSAFRRLTRAPFLIAESLRGKSGKDSNKTGE